MVSLNSTRKQLHVPITSHKDKKHVELVYDELSLEKLKRYYGFEKREELLEFLKTQCIFD